MKYLLILIVLCATSFVLGQSEEVNTEWWKHGVFYQIYPRSFRDSDNDGNGDLKGILEKLGHLKDAGVTGVWISPIFKSPQIDMGYDISDYYEVDPMYGTNDDLKALIEKAHELGIRIILDFVPNHTSDQHEWFKASLNGSEDYKDFYVWAGEKGKVPNNWISVFKNSAWEWSEQRQQYYLHQFLKAQPDLNYRNPQVREAMKNVLLHYLDLGVDGFRIDAVPHIMEVEDLRDEPRSDDSSATENDYEYLTHIYTTNLLETYDVIYEWRELLDNYSIAHGGDQRILMTEAYANISSTMLYYGTADGSRLGAHFSFNFKLITDININSTASDVFFAIVSWLTAIPDIYQSNWVIGNHDNHRVATRLGVENLDAYNMLVFLLPGIGVTYNGEEIGQENGNVTYEEGQDTSARNRSTFEKVSRDFERTPFQWDTTENAGFNEGAKPWLPVSEKYVETNLQNQVEGSSKTHYHIYQKLIKKRQEDMFKLTSYHVGVLFDNVLFVKRWKDKNAVIMLFNLSDEPTDVDIGFIVCNGTLSVAITSSNSNRNEGENVTSKLNVDSHEAIVLDLVLGDMPCPSKSEEISQELFKSS